MIEVTEVKERAPLADVYELMSDKQYLIVVPGDQTVTALSMQEWIRHQGVNAVVVPFDGLKLYELKLPEGM